jgi:hypothetical protein
MSMELAPPQAVTAGTQQRSPFEISRPISWAYWLVQPKMFHLHYGTASSHR